MPDVNWNSEMWNDKHDWPGHGEEWSEPWGGAEAQWFGSFYPRIHKFLPAPSVLEIATGFGRWTRYLVPQCAQYLGVDLSVNAIENCKKVFSRFNHAHFVSNDGLSIEAAKDGEFDLVFSADSLVHVEADVMTSYITQSLRKLRPAGVAFLHHSNVFEFAHRLSSVSDQDIGFRGRSVSGELVRKIIETQGGRLLVQEMVNWGSGETLGDCFTLFARQDYPSDVKPVILRNNQFRLEASLIKEFQSPYSQLDAKKASPPQA